jgi:hypothetical protein
MVITPEKQEYMRQWRLKNREHIKASRKAYYTANKEREKAKVKSWTARQMLRSPRYNADKCTVRRGTKQYKEYMREYKKKYYREKESKDPEWLLKSRLRARLRRAIVCDLKQGSAVRDLGCSVAEFKNYIEQLFKDGMSWENWGEWHIDHIKPLATFDLLDHEQFLQAVNYRNMQPLWATDNYKKGKRWIS